MADGHLTARGQDELLAKAVRERDALRQANYRLRSGTTRAMRWLNDRQDPPLYASEILRDALEGTEVPRG